MKKEILFLLFLLAAEAIYAREYIYPVAVTHKENQTLVYLFYQKSLHHSELWLWNPTTQIAHKALLSRYTPAGLQVLPNQESFSFIDNDRIKIKHLLKRSPKALELYEPLYDISTITWLDNETCYFHAKKENHFGIFQATIDGDVQSFIEPSDTSDSMYPQKVTNKLFYIERCATAREYTYRIMQSPYEPGSVDRPATTVFNFNDRPIAFLHMTSTKEGYVIEHPDTIDKHDGILPFVCYKLEQADNNTWNAEHLFSFNIPLDFLLPNSENRLYESMLPLLPRYYDDSIIFAHTTDKQEGGVTLFCYDMKTKKTAPLAPLCKNREAVFFAPVAIEKNRVLFGGALDETLDHATVLKLHMPHMWLEKEQLKLYLPQLNF